MKMVHAATCEYTSSAYEALELVRLNLHRKEISKIIHRRFRAEFSRQSFEYYIKDYPNMLKRMLDEMDYAALDRQYNEEMNGDEGKAPRLQNSGVITEKDRKPVDLTKVKPREKLTYQEYRKLAKRFTEITNLLASA